MSDAKSFDVGLLSCNLVRPVLSYRVLFLCKMNPLDVTALDLLVAHDSCWEGVILCPNLDGSGEYNLLCQKAVQFRKTKCGLKEGGLLVHSHSRQHTPGIRIPTSFAAVVGEWDNVRKQVATWAWNGGAIIVANHQQGLRRHNLLDKIMRCSRCDGYAPPLEKVASV
jgi:hypothetical protein